jgi:hypothetical protein
VDILINEATPQHMETMALRHILKHLRSRRLMAPFKALTACADVQLEHPLVTRFYDSVVSDGNWAEAERVLQLAADAGLFDTYAREAPAQATWTRLSGTSADGDAPRQRGGHAMCIDEAAGGIYLYGGWDGERSLDDFWVYAIAEGRWRVVARCENAVWPGRRSCHKMAFDAGTGRIYLLGCLSVSDDDLRESDPARARSPGASAGEPRPPTQRADFYAYHTRGDNAGVWELLSADTEVLRSFLAARGSDRFYRRRADHHGSSIIKWSWIRSEGASTYAAAASMTGHPTWPSFQGFIATMWLPERGLNFREKSIAFL